MLYVFQFAKYLYSFKEERGNNFQNAAAICNSALSDSVQKKWREGNEPLSTLLLRIWN